MNYTEGNLAKVFREIVQLWNDGEISVREIAEALESSYQSADTNRNAPSRSTIYRKLEDQSNLKIFRKPAFQAFQSILNFKGMSNSQEELRHLSDQTKIVGEEFSREHDSLMTIYIKSSDGKTVIVKKVSEIELSSIL